MPPKVNDYLRHILEAADRIEQFIGTATLAEYRRNPLLRSAVERQFITIGEAVRRVAGADLALADRITNRRRIVGFRNILVHRYFYIDDSVVWTAAANHLPLLRREVAALLAEF